MARNEQELKDRWARAYRNSGEYLAAQRRDAIAKVQRTRGARDAMHAALVRGDAARASRIQSSLQQEDSQPGENATGLDAFQNQRATDYITQAEQRGQQQANAARSGPLSGVAYGPGYYAGLDDPDFSTHFPYGDLAPKIRVGMGDVAPSVKPTAAPRTPAAPGKAITPDYLSLRRDPSGATRQAFLDAENDRVAAQRHEQHFTSSLPNELRSPYASLTGGMTPEEKTDFLSQPPELRYGRLRTQLAASQPKTPGTGGEIVDRYGVTRDYLPSGQENPGTVGSSDFPAITKPVTLSRPTAQLTRPTAAPARPQIDDSLEARAFGF